MEAYHFYPVRLILCLCQLTGRSVQTCSIIYMSPVVRKTSNKLEQLLFFCMLIMHTSYLLYKSSCGACSSSCRACSELNSLQLSHPRDWLYTAHFNSNILEERDVLWAKFEPTKFIQFVSHTKHV